MHGKQNEVPPLVLIRLYNYQQTLKLKDALELRAACKTNQTRGSYVFQLGLATIRDVVNIMPQTNTGRLEEILPTRSGSLPNPAADGHSDYLSD